MCLWSRWKNLSRFHCFGSGIGVERIISSPKAHVCYIVDCSNPFTTLRCSEVAEVSGFPTPRSLSKTVSSNKSICPHCTHSCERWHKTNKNSRFQGNSYNASLGCSQWMTIVHSENTRAGHILGSVGSIWLSMRLPNLWSLQLQNNFERVAIN